MSVCPWRVSSRRCNRPASAGSLSRRPANDGRFTEQWEIAIDSIAGATYWLIRGRNLFLFLHLLGLACFAYIAARRLMPLLRAQRDFRFDRPLERLGRVLQFWLAQWRHPRYRFAGTIHILVFAGFLILASRAFSLLALGISDRFAVESGGLYDTVRDYASTVVFLCMGIAIVRRLFFPPAALRPSLRGCDFPARVDRYPDGRGRRFRGQRRLPFMRSRAHARRVPSALLAALDPASRFRVRFPDGAAQSAPGRVSGPRVHLLLPALLPAVRHPVPRRDVAVSIYFAKLDRGTREARAMGRRGRATGRACHLSASRSSRTSPGSTSWISTPAPTAAGAPTSARPTRWAAAVARGPSRSSREITLSSITRYSAAPTDGDALVGGHLLRG